MHIFTRLKNVKKRVNSKYIIIKNAVLKVFNIQNGAKRRVLITQKCLRIVKTIKIDPPQQTNLCVLLNTYFATS